MFTKHFQKYYNLGYECVINVLRLDEIQDCVKHIVREGRVYGFRMKRTNRVWKIHIYKDEVKCSYGGGRDVWKI